MSKTARFGLRSNFAPSHFRNAPAGPKYLEHRLDGTFELFCLPSQFALATLPLAVEIPASVVQELLQVAGIIVKKILVCVIADQQFDIPHNENRACLA